MSRCIRFNLRLKYKSKLSKKYIIFKIYYLKFCY